MLGLGADENFDGRIVDGLRRHLSGIDVVRIQDVGLSGAPDPEVLDWAAREQRVLLSHDVSTVPGFAYERIEAGLAMPGVFLVVRGFVGDAVEEIALIALIA